MSTGNRCAIYDSIEALDEARTVADLVRRLKPILSELAYYGVTGESAILEAHEEWRTQYNDHLRQESGAAQAQKAAAMPAAYVPPPTRAHSSHGSHGSSHVSHGSSHGSHGSSHGSHGSSHGSHSSHSSHESHRSGSKNRNTEYENSMYTPSHINSNGVPSALLAIMKGTHPSFKE